MTDRAEKASGCGHAPKWVWLGRVLREFRGGVFTAILQLDPDVTPDQRVRDLIAAAPDQHAELSHIWSQIEAAGLDDINDDNDVALLTITAPQARAIRAVLSKATKGE